MTARVTRLTVVAAGFASARRRLEPDTRLPTLERLLARGERHDRAATDAAFQSLEIWQHDVLRVLSMEALPSAPVSAIGAGLDGGGDGEWLHAQLVHFAAGLNDLALVPLEGVQSVSSEIDAALQSHLAEHVREEGFEWQSSAHSSFLHTHAALDAQTCAPHAATRMPLVEAMPRGRDGRKLRRLMTELQMQLHEHPVNRERERAGQLAVNGVWLWGLGSRPSQQPRTLPMGFADDDFVRGLYRLHAAECAPVPVDGEALMNGAASDVLVRLHCDSLSDLDARWLAPFERALNAGQLEQLELIVDDMQLTATRWHRWRLWRRVRPLEPRAS